jgi:1,4-alpha-glucan branching enzyme
MLKKSYSKTGQYCRVTFKTPEEVNARTASLCGEFNDWDASAHPMKRLKDGSFSATVSLEAGCLYRFRYLLDGHRWENDWAADAYIPNEFDSDDSVVEV